jgi:hypothetical protein
MLALAISMDVDTRGNTIIETNAGRELTARRWPQDSESQLVAFRPSGKTCQVVWTEQLAGDIARALELLDSVDICRGAKPDWYRRLQTYCSGMGKPRLKN